MAKIEFQSEQDFVTGIKRIAVFKKHICTYEWNVMRKMPKHHA